MLLLLASCRRLLLGLQLDVSGYLSLFTSLLGQLQIVCERERALLLLTAAAGTQTLGFGSCTCSLKPVHATAMGLWESNPLQSL